VLAPAADDLDMMTRTAMVVAMKAVSLSWVRARAELVEGKAVVTFLVIARGFEGGRQGRLRG
jgi:hypothetical protein